jgi:hypothetical protein
MCLNNNVVKLCLWQEIGIEEVSRLNIVDMSAKYYPHYFTSEVVNASVIIHHVIENP